MESLNPIRAAFCGEATQNPGLSFGQQEGLDENTQRHDGAGCMGWGFWNKTLGGWARHYKKGAERRQAEVEEVYT
jgi:hypothetical protein